jgi:hypothetical protein
MEPRKRSALPLPRASGRCGFGQGTFARVSSDDEDAPLPVIRGTGIELVGSTQTGPAPYPDNFDRFVT